MDSAPQYSILIVDDDSLVRDIYSTAFKSRGYQVYTAENGQRGIELACSVVPRVILLDLLMPCVDGFEALRKLRAESKTSLIPIFVLSVLSDEECFDRVMESGADCFFPKADFTPSQVCSLVHDWLSGDSSPMSNNFNGYCRKKGGKSKC